MGFPDWPPRAPGSSPVCINRRTASGASFLWSLPVPICNYSEHDSEPLGISICDSDSREGRSRAVPTTPQNGGCKGELASSILPERRRWSGRQTALCRREKARESAGAKCQHGHGHGPVPNLSPDVFWLTAWSQRPVSERGISAFS
jgi:hypothetical protein